MDELISMSGLSEKYNIINFLGEGAFGFVYHAIDNLSGVEVAIKLQKNPTQGKEMFTKEINTLKYIQPECKRLLCILDAGVLSNGVIYIVTEFIKGDSLDEFLKNNLISEELKHKLFKQLILGFVNMTKLHVFHSDLKPENIMIEDSTQDLKIVDFGLACDYQLDCGGGTPLYMSSEYYSKSRGITPEDVFFNDIYSVGLISYEIYYNDPVYNIFKSLSKEYNIPLNPQDHPNEFASLIRLTSMKIRQKVLLEDDTNAILEFIHSSLQETPKQREVLLHKWQYDYMK